MDVEAALKRANYAVRQELREMPGTFGTAVYLYFGACTTTAYLDRSPDLLSLDRCRLVFSNLIFMRYWHAHLEVTNQPQQQHFISGQTYQASLLLNHAMVFVVLAFGRLFPDHPFCQWLIGSDQCEKLYSEWRSFVLNKPDWNLLDLFYIMRRWAEQMAMLAKPDVHLPPNESLKGHNRSLYESSKSKPYVQKSWPTPADLQRAYSEEVLVVQPYLVQCGMAEDLRRLDYGRRRRSSNGIGWRSWWRIRRM